MKIIRYGLLALCLSMFGACVADEAAPTSDEAPEVSTTEQYLGLPPITFKPTNAPAWEPKETTCKRLEGVITIPDASGSCSTVITTTNCRWNSTTQECVCDRTQQRTGAGCS